MTTDKIIPFPAPVLKESEHSSFTEQVAKRFRLVPNFFVSAPDAPEILEKLWAFAAAAYLDNPIPTLLIVRHTGFLVGYGQAAGDPAAQTQTIEQMIELLQTAPPWRRDLEPIYSSLAARKKPVDWPAPGSEIEDQLFALCTLIFVNPTQSERALNALRQALGGKRCEYVLALLAFIRTAHFWTLVHPGIAMEDDVKELLGEYKVLAALLLQEPEPLPE